jgi:DNA-binding NarL/FixJ family response regulator
VKNDKSHFMASPLASTVNKARILIVDDHPMLRSGLLCLIDKQPDLVCCAEAADVAEVWKAMSTQKPDLVILDLRLKSSDGLELIKSLRSQYPATRILVLTQHAAAVYVERVLRAGAHGFVAKEEAAQVILQAIRTVLAGEVYLTRPMAALFLSRMMGKAGEVTREDCGRLSDRELHVVQLLGAGLSTREVANRLNLSFKTIETHRENIKRKLGLRGAAELVYFAARWVRENVALEPQSPPEAPAGKF